MALRSQPVALMMGLIALVVSAGGFVIWWLGLYLCEVPPLPRKRGPVSAKYGLGRKLLRVSTKRSIGGVILVAVGFFISPSSSSGAEARAAKQCGDIPSRLIYDIRTKRVSCTTARRVARQWGSQCAQTPTGSCTVSAGFYCQYRATGYESGAIRCARSGGRVVRFVTGS